MDDLAPGRSLLRRDDPARVAARTSRIGRPENPSDDDDGPVVPRVPPPRHPDPVDDEPRRSVVLARRANAIDEARAEQRAEQKADDQSAQRAPANRLPAPSGRAVVADFTTRSPAGSARPSIGMGRLNAGAGRSGSSMAAPVSASRRRDEQQSLGSRGPLGGEPEFVRRVNPFELPDPRGYAHATVAHGQIIFLAGQTGVDLDGRIVDGGMVKQFDRAVQNLLTALTAAGGGPEYLASVVVQVTSIDEYKANSRPIGHVWRARLAGGLPALSLIEVRRFWDADAVVQLEGHAVIP